MLEDLAVGAGHVVGAADLVGMEEELVVLEDVLGVRHQLRRDECPADDDLLGGDEPVSDREVLVDIGGLAVRAALDNPVSQSRS